MNMNDKALQAAWNELVGDQVRDDWAAFGDLLIGNAVTHCNVDGTAEVHVPGKYIWEGEGDSPTVAALMMESDREPVVFVMLTEADEPDCVIASGFVNLEGAIVKFPIFAEAS